MNYQNIIVTTCSIFLSILSFSGTAYAEQKIPPKNPVVFLLSSQRELYGSGKKTGVWLDALATPYYKLKDAGFDVVLVIMQDQDAKPLVVLMHGNRKVSTKNLARQIGG